MGPEDTALPEMDRAPGLEGLTFKQETKNKRVSNLLGGGKCSEELNAGTGGRRGSCPLTWGLVRVGLADEMPAWMEICVLWGVSEPSCLPRRRASQAEQTEVQRRAGAEPGRWE